MVMPRALPPGPVPRQMPMSAFDEDIRAGQAGYKHHRGPVINASTGARARARRLAASAPARAEGNEETRSADDHIADRAAHRARGPPGGAGGGPAGSSILAAGDRLSRGGRTATTRGIGAIHQARHGGRGGGRARLPAAAGLPDLHLPRRTGPGEVGAARRGALSPAACPARLVRGAYPPPARRGLDPGRHGRHRHRRPAPDQQRLDAGVLLARHLGADGDAAPLVLPGRGRPGGRDHAGGAGPRRPERRCGLVPVRRGLPGRHAGRAGVAGRGHPQAAGGPAGAGRGGGHPRAAAHRRRTAPHAGRRARVDSRPRRTGHGPARRRRRTAPRTAGTGRGFPRHPGRLRVWIPGEVT
jgi:hypothetical protein